MHGQVTHAKMGEPLMNATVDIWQASTNGKYSSDLILPHRTG